MCFQFHLNDSSPWSRSCSLSLHFFLTLLHFSVPIFHFSYKNSPLLKVARPFPIAAVFKIIITHIAFFPYQIHFRMNDAENKNRNPQKSRTCTLSQNLLLGVKPISLCEANEQASF